jgi:DNA-directed RNA polymerase specialized sigma24 family protein
MIRASNEWEDKRTDIIYRLRHYRSMVAEYQACKELYDEMFPNCTQVLSDMPKAPSELYEPERWASRRISQSERMQQSLDRMHEALLEVEQLTDLVDGNYRTVLVRRYYLNESYETIAEKMHYSEIWVRKTHNKALDTIIRKCIA